jgi:hypothetical protein
MRVAGQALGEFLMRLEVHLMRGAVAVLPRHRCCHSRPVPSLLRPQVLNLHLPQPLTPLLDLDIADMTLDRDSRAKSRTFYLQFVE